jgi:hypothetical protein
VDHSQRIAARRKKLEPTVGSDLRYQVTETSADRGNSLPLRTKREIVKNPRFSSLVLLLPDFLAEFNHCFVYGSALGMDTLNRLTQYGTVAKIRLAESNVVIGDCNDETDRMETLRVGKRVFDDGFPGRDRFRGGWWNGS